MNTVGPVSVRTAGFWVRLAAFLVDALLPALLALGASALFGLFAADRLPPRIYNRLDWLVDVWNLRPAAMLVPACLFCALLTALDAVGQILLGWTPGRRLLGLALVDRDGNPPRPGRLAVRAVVRVALLAPLGLGALVAVVHRQRRALHDVLVGTWVVWRRSDPVAAAPPRRSQRRESAPAKAPADGREPAWIRPSRRA